MVAAEVQVKVIEDKTEKPEEVQKEVNNGLLCLSGLHFKYVSALTSLKIRLQSRRQQETEKKTKSQLLTAGVGARRAGHHDIVMELVLAGADIEVSDAPSDWSVRCNEEL